MNIIWLDSIDSTNSEALRRLRTLPSGTVLAAREQTAGRGQRGNSWFTEPGKNLTFSLVLKFEEDMLPAAQAHWLNYLTSVAITRFLDTYGVDSRIKWPNDIYVNRRKICGVLIENTLRDSSLEASVIGVGININQRTFPQLANATSLYNCCGKEHDLDLCMEQLSGFFQDELSALFDEDSRVALFERYSSRLFQRGVQALYRDLLQDEEYSGVLEGVEADGRLCIREGKVCRYYRFKEVSYIL